MRRRVIATPRSEWVDPAVAFQALCRGDSPAFWLDSGVSATTGWSYLGVASRTVTASIEGGSLTEWPSGARRDGTVLDFLREELGPGIEADDPAGAGPFRLGWVGWLGYELHTQTMGTGIRRPSRYPDAALMFVDRALAFDHATRTVALLAIGDDWTGELAAWREATEAALSPPVVRDFRRNGMGQSAQNRAQTARWAYTD
ncbi:MAG TPA: aminodeoxychorismate synthase component I, partial [Terrimesophilobacter sp.]|nr:aminodeoxychorismate synthase component I [Terrimesophilobacter sp.]